MSMRERERERERETILQYYLFKFAIIGMVWFHRYFR